MSIQLATWFVHGLTAYVGLGLLVAIPFVWRGASRIDPSAAQGTWGFRLLILPGAVAFWPLLGWRWLRGVSEPPAERNPHRCAARPGASP